MPNSRKRKELEIVDEDEPLLNESDTDDEEDDDDDDNDDGKEDTDIASLLAPPSAVCTPVPTNGRSNTNTFAKQKCLKCHRSARKGVSTVSVRSERALFVSS